VQHFSAFKRVFHMALSISKLLKASQAAGGGRWTQANYVLRRVLGLVRTPEASPALPAAQADTAVASPALPVKAKLPLRKGPLDSANDAAFVSNQLRTAPEALDVIEDAPLTEVPVIKAPVARAPVARPAPTTRPASFTRHTFQFAGAPYAYRLYQPTQADSSGAEPLPSLPLLIMLHGCKQDAADFAQGTAMNEWAEQHGCIVLYPEQPAKANALRCWNWFDTAHQGRDSGEPGMLAALTRKVLKSHNVDPKRVYIAGLSAGGAMAAVMAGLYPELYAAVGVHSGVPTGAASGVISALSVMRRGARRATAQGEPEGLMPTIVFHGGADRTVHPENGEQIVNAALLTLNACGLILNKTEVADDGATRPAEVKEVAGAAELAAVDAHDAAPGRDAFRTVYRAADGKSYVEHWEVGTGPHAWSGGNPAGSFTDPQGPDASRAMLAFFLQHSKHPTDAQSAAPASASSAGN
jgi:poly(hydroxyalkanoate) depolymerase family esterase